MIPTLEHDIEHLLTQLTLDEKVSLCHGDTLFSLPGVPRLGIPPLKLSDGPHGVRQEISPATWQPAGWVTDFATYLPTGTALAATWNEALAHQAGEVLGAETRERGKDVILGPGINIIRTPLCGRNFEYYGEDPHHISRMVVPMIQGIQSQDVAACVKHFACNNQELDRLNVNVEVDERALRELYLPGFQAAVQEGGVLTLMGAYNQLRGQHCSHNAYLLNTILKQEWGFDGVVISDWAATHDTREAALNGLDVEMGTCKPFEDYYLANPFLTELKAGTIPLAAVDEKVRRVLRCMMRIGLFHQTRKAGARNTRAHQQAALAVAREAMVLLKNDNRLLPLRADTLRTLLVVGDNATTLHHSGGNSSSVKAPYEVTPLEGLRRKLAGKVAIEFRPGYPRPDDPSEVIPATCLVPKEGSPGASGWRQQVFGKQGMAEILVQTTIEPAIDVQWCPDRLPPGVTGAHSGYVVRWEASLTAPESGVYEFYFTGAEHALFILGEDQLVQRWENGGPSRIYKTAYLEAGQTYPVSVTVMPSSPMVHIRAGWVKPSQATLAATPVDPELLATARKADVVLFFGGLTHQHDVEASDRRDLILPDGQDALIAALAGANPRTVVILAGGSPVEMPWIKEVSTVLWMWYAGQEAGTALAEILLGEVNPSGKLPFTFPMRLADTPVAVTGEYRSKHCEYKEGIFVGYRWYDARGIAPLFPFGHGLSYTSFDYSEVSVSATGEGADWRARVSLTLRNSGTLPGAEVVQLYITPAPAPVARPPRELKGFRKIRLEANGSQQVTFTLTRADLSYYDVARKAWHAMSGTYGIELGSSSRDIKAHYPVLFGG